MDIWAFLIGRLLNGYEYDRRWEMPRYDEEILRPPPDMRYPEFAAYRLRNVLQIPRGPIENVVTLIEANGGLVVPMDFGTSKIDAVCSRIPGLPVLFYVNRDAPTDRLRFSLCHEIAHVVLHSAEDVPEEIAEAEADIFASCLLMPKEDIRHQLGGFNLKTAARLKSHWKVSMQALAMRAADLDVISSHQKTRFFIELGRRGFRTQEPYEPKNERWILLRQIFNHHLRDLDFTKDDLAKMFGISDVDVERCLETIEVPERSEGPRLRLV